MNISASIFKAFASAGENNLEDEYDWDAVDYFTRDDAGIWWPHDVVGNRIDKPGLILVLTPCQ